MAQTFTARSSRTSTSAPRKQEVVKTWAFDSAGTRKYALQIKKASNGNPCLAIVEGTPQPDGTYRKFNITVWSEDFERLFTTIDEVRAFIADHHIKTPVGHKYDPSKPRRFAGKTKSDIVRKQTAMAQNDSVAHAPSAGLAS